MPQPGALPTNYPNPGPGMYRCDWTGRLLYYSIVKVPETASPLTVADFKLLTQFIF